MVCAYPAEGGAWQECKSPPLKSFEVKIIISVSEIYTVITIKLVLNSNALRPFSQPSEVH